MCVRVEVVGWGGGEQPHARTDTEGWRVPHSLLSPGHQHSPTFPSQRAATVLTQSGACSAATGSPQQPRCLDVTPHGGACPSFPAEAVRGCRLDLVQGTAWPVRLHCRANTQLQGFCLPFLCKRRAAPVQPDSRRRGKDWGRQLRDQSALLQ